MRSPLNNDQAEDTVFLARNDAAAALRLHPGPRHNGNNCRHRLLISLQLARLFRVLFVCGFRPLVVSEPGVWNKVSKRRHRQQHATSRRPQKSLRSTVSVLLNGGFCLGKGVATMTDLLDKGSDD
jgi:transposase